MDCPFCAGALKADATYCLQCRRDFAPIKIHIERADRLQSQLEEALSRAAPEDQQRCVYERRMAQASWTVDRVSDLLTLSFLVIVFLVAPRVEALSTAQFVAINLAVPLLMGFSIGAALRGVRIQRYMLTGAALSAAFMAGLAATHGVEALKMNIIVLLGSGYILLTTFGGVSTDWIEHRVRPGEVEDPSRTIAAGFLRSGAAGFENRLDRVSNILKAGAAITPIIGGLVTWLASGAASQ